jgi:antitoxin (DNA-binding transcriptional repressor) of toxin-antitoxin stability system
MPVGQFKSRFSEAIERVRAGESVVISYGRKHTRVAVLSPYRTRAAAGKKRVLGTLKGRVKVTFHSDYQLSDEDLLAS